MFGAVFGFLFLVGCLLAALVIFHPGYFALAVVLAIAIGVWRQR